MSEPRPIPRSLTSFSQSGKKFSEKPKSKPKPESEWPKQLALPKPDIKEHSEPLHPNLGFLQPGFGKRKLLKRQEISHIRVEIPPATIPMTSDDEDVPLSTICELIGTLPDLVQAQIMKYQRIAEQNRPIRCKINAEFQRIVTIQMIIVGNNRAWPLYPSFIKFMKKHFSRDLVETHSRVVEMTETRKNIIGWMYQFERIFCKRPFTRIFNY